MQYSAMTFAAPVRVTFERFYRPTVSVKRACDDDPAGRSGPVQSGDVNLYLFYGFAAVLIAYLLGAL